MIRTFTGTCEFADTFLMENNKPFLNFATFTTIFLLMTASSHADVAQSFTFDGRLYADGTSTTVMTDPNVTLKVQILNQSQTCIIYEETQSGIDTSLSNGFFTVRVGSAIGAGKRSGNDSGNSMSKVYANDGGAITGKLVSNGSACSYTPSTGDGRYMRVIVTPSLTGIASTLSPNMPLDSVPSAVVAERAQTVQGLAPSNLLQVNTSGSEVLSQTNLENIFTSTNYSALTSLLAGSSTLYTKPAANGTTALPSLTSPTSPAAGQIWYDGGTIKYYNGSTTQTLGTSGAGITSLAAGTGLNVGTGPGGTITTSGTLNIDVGTTTGKILQVDTGNKLPVIDGSQLTNLPAPTSVAGSTISGTIGGSTAINTTGTINSGAITSSGAVTGSTGSFNSISTGQLSLFDHATTNTNYVTIRTPATATLTADYTLTLPPALPVSGTQALTSDSSGTLSWSSLATGSVTSVTSAGAPITIGGTTAAPTVGVSAATTSASGVVTLAADGGTTASTVVQATDSRLSAIKSQPVTYTTLTTGDILKYNGSAWVNVALSSAQLSNNSDLLKASSMPANCSAGSTLTFSSPTGTWLCSTITVGASNFSSQSANIVLAGPTTGSAVPTFRALVVGDLPTGTSSTTVALGNDARFPSGSCGSGNTMRFNGTAWVCEASGSGADNMGNHTASQNLNLATFKLVGNGGTDGIAIDSAGKVGIGTTSPGDTLHVVGKIRATHICYTDGTNCKDVSTAWSGGTVTSVTSAGAPITIGGTTAAPTVGVSAATTSASGVVTLAADGGTTASTVVQANDSRLSAIKGQPVTYTSLTTGDMLKYNGSAWVNSPLSVGASNFSSQSANIVLAGPTTGSAVPTFRALTVGDLPTGTSSTTVALGNDARFPSGTCGTGNTMRYNGTAWVCEASATGTVTSVTSAGAPITIGGTTAAPTIGVSAATTSASGVVTLAADGGTTASTVVQANDSRLSAIKSQPVTYTSLTTGDILKYNGSAWVNVALSSAQLSNNSDLLKASNMPANCSAGSTLTFSSPTGTWVCSTITVGASNFSSQSANVVLAGPTTGSAVPTFRSLVVGDLPTGTSSTTIAIGNDSRFPSSTCASGNKNRWSGSAWVCETDATGSLANFTEAVSSSSPNATVPVVSLKATNAATNVDMALSPKGTGALTAHVADSATTGGNKRGANSVDWQSLRAAATQVASGAYATIGGGRYNTVSGDGATVAGGDQNRALGTVSTVGGGANNNASDTYATVGGGYMNTAAAQAVVSGGIGNNASSTSSTVIGGYYSTASGNASIAGGYSTTAAGDRSLALGYTLNSKSYGQVTFGLFNQLTGSESSFSWVTTDPLFVVGNGTAAGSTSNALMILKNGNTGIGTTTPGTNTKLYVAGQIASASGSISTGTIDFSVGNSVTTSFDCGSALTLANVRNGGTYILIVTGTGTTQCSFPSSTTGDDASSVTYKWQAANAVRTASTHTMYTLVRVGTIIYVSWATGFQ